MAALESSRYLWGDPSGSSLHIFELWGHPEADGRHGFFAGSSRSIQPSSVLWSFHQAIITVADQLNLLQMEVEVLLSPQMARRPGVVAFSYWIPQPECSSGGPPTRVHGTTSLGKGLFVRSNAVLGWLSFSQQLNKSCFWF